MNKLIKSDNYLVNYGFKYGINSGPCGESGYTNTFIHANGSECLWITVDFNHKKVHLYNEFECGGELSRSKIDIADEIIDDEDAFIKWLDAYIPDEEY